MVNYDSTMNKPYEKKNRSAIACLSCRTSKVKCIRQEGTSQCNRCHSLDISCTFEAKQSQRKGMIRKRIMQSQLSQIEDFASLQLTLPKKGYIIELVEIFFANQYQGIFPFLHKPTFLSFLRSDQFNPSTYIDEYKSKFFTEKYSSNISRPDPILLLSILALCARLHSRITLSYGKFLEDESPETFSPDFTFLDSQHPAPKSLDPDLVSASNASKYFGWHARHYMKDVFDSPTVQRIQAFTLLSSHEWGEGNNSRSFLYIGIAARMALVLGLGNEKGLRSSEDEVEDERLQQIVIESKRRTIWSVYMMDRCNSSGRERSPAIKIEDINIKLPSNENDFLFGNSNPSMTYQELYSQLSKPPEINTNNLSLRGYTIVLFEIWAKIAKWVGEVGAKYERSSPWLSGSTFKSLCQLLDYVYDIMPQNYKFSDFNLRTHIELKTATHFGYCHGLYFLCRIFLNREYLFCNPNSFPSGWWTNLTTDLLDSLENISFLIEELRNYNMMVIAPFTGFEVFTCAVTSLYLCAFPDEILIQHLPFNLLTLESSLGDLDNWKTKYKTLALKNMEALSSWTHTWELGRNWHDLSINLGAIFNQLAECESDIINAEYLRHSMQDYGNGKVSEVYVPQKSIKTNQKNDMEILKLLNKEDTLTRTATTKSQSPLYDNVLEFISPPQFPLGRSVNSPSIYPGWNDLENI